MTKKQRKIFLQLIQACHETDAYTVPTMCCKMKISYSQLLAWAKEDERCADALQFCHIICSMNTETAGLMGRLLPEEALQFLGENHVPN